MRLALALALLLSAARAAEPAFTAVVDPGHGGEKTGALGPGGAAEKNVALAIARRVAKRLAKLGGRTILTRTGDTTVPLASRAALANAKNADLFISIHLNSMPTEEARKVTHGIETYFLSADATDESATAVAARENADRLAGEEGPDPSDPVAGILDDLDRQQALAMSSRLAYAVQEQLVKECSAEDRGVKQAPFYVLAGARMPAVLVEVGFVSNPTEAKKLLSAGYQDEIAKAIADGVKAFRAQAVKGAP